MGVDYFESRIGLLKIVASDVYVEKIDFVDQIDEEVNSNALTEKTKLQLKEYFMGKRMEFDLPVKLQGTEFQVKVWEALRQIPFGETRTYKDIANIIGNPKAVRAVGQANNKNKIVILVPCHRVIGSNSKLVGYGGGIIRKLALIDHEKEILDLI